MGNETDKRELLRLFRQISCGPITIKKEDPPDPDPKQGKGDDK